MPSARRNTPSESDEDGRRAVARRNAGVSESERSDTDSLRQNFSRSRDGHSRTKDRSKRSSRTKRYFWQRGLLATLFLCGPIGTVISFFLLPKEATPETSAPPDGGLGLGGLAPGPGFAGAGGAAGGTPGVARMVHLTLVGTQRRARFVVDEHTVWESFLAGCRDRLQVGKIRRVTDSSGEAILAVEDLVHDDRVMIYADILDKPFQPDPEDAAEAAAEAAADGVSEGGGGVGGRLPGASLDSLLPAALPKALTRDGGLPTRQAGRALTSLGEAAPNRSEGAADGGAELGDEAVGQVAGQQGLPGQRIDAAEVAAEGAHGGGGVQRNRGRTSMPELLNQLTALHPGKGDEGRISEQELAAEAVVPGIGTVDDLLGDPDQPQEKCGDRHPQFRVAMLIPWVNELPPWLSYFITTARLSQYLVDYLVFHETLTPPQHLPPNVRFIDLGQGGLAQLFGLKMGEELGMPVRNASLLIRSMRFMLEKWPRLVAEYKPAFGSIFEQYLSEYSHWGYCDLDMVIGNIPLFIEHAELEAQDIVTYSFGDVDALYLRGQWTVHRNDRAVSLLWKGCPHLGDDLQKELLMKVAWVRRMESRGIKNYPKRFQSAEGCYSHRAAMAPGIRIKMAHKQFVGLTVPSDEQIYFVNGAVWQCPKGEDVDVQVLQAHSQQPCAANLPGVQEALGDMLPLQVNAEGGCGNWMPVEYRMCAVNMPEPPEREANTVGFNTYLRDGKFFAQRFRSTLPVLDNGCKQGAFFHMQEWKKIWGYGTHGVDPLELALASKGPPTFTVTTEGITLLT